MIKTREEAKEHRQHSYTPDPPCSRGHSAPHLTSTGECTGCIALHRQASRRWRPEGAAPREEGLPPIMGGEEVPKGPLGPPLEALALGAYRIQHTPTAWLLRSVVDPVTGEFPNLSAALAMIARLRVSEDTPTGEYFNEVKRVQRELIEKALAQLPRLGAITAPVFPT